MGKMTTDDIDTIRDYDYRRWGQATLYEGIIPLTPAEQHRHTLLAALDALQERFHDKCCWLTRMTRERDEAREEVERLFIEGQQAKRERSQHVAWLDDAKVMIATLRDALREAP